MGRVVMCAIICIICDLPGARKFGGFSACTHSFYCAICLCRLPGSIKHSIDTNVDQLECPSCECLKPEHAFGCWNVSTWERRQYYDTVARATAFNLAPDEASAQSSFDQSGLRYTELLELPYFDPTRFIVVDSMHNLFLGLLKEHFMNVLGYNSKMKDAEEICDVFPYPIQPSDSNPLPIKESEQSSVDKLLSRENVDSTIAVDPDLDHVTHGQVFSKTDMEALWEDIRNTTTPSWLSSVPGNLGNHTGKLKADQWRTAATVYYPITLIRLWSMENTSTPARHQNRNRKLLSLFLALVSAVNIVISRTTSQTHAKNTCAT
ncbi:Immunoglobulin G-binding protein [Salix suchowensis]|nr:Immunoglobulin G-binding protein [Salix suchowensis]